MENKPSMSSPSFEDSMPNQEAPFFADATLDLEEAHDIAETPEARKPKYSRPIVGDNHKNLQMPVLRTMEEGEEAASPENNNNNNTHASPNNNKSNFSRITSLETDYRRSTPPKSVPRWPRDIPWAVSFVLVVPLSLIWPILIEKHDEHVSRLVHHPLSTATIHTLLWAGLATLVLSRLLYRTAGGGDGDDARHVAAQILTLSAPISVTVSTTLAVMIWWTCPKAKLAALIPAWYTIKDVYLFRRWKRRSQQAGTGSRQAFFQALCCMALDILSRSLRRASFYRVLSAILLCQFGVLILWRWALLGALGSGSWFVFLLAIVGGKWATGTVARLLSLLACGGVTSWFVQQSALLEELPEPQTQATENGEEESDAGQDMSTSSMPEAYRTADASVYQSVLDMDDALDDDYLDDDDELIEAPNRRIEVRERRIVKSNVKSILAAGLTVSFGSVAQCGLLGGPAQFIWSQIRKIEAAQTAISRVRDETGFQGMQIGGSDTSLLTKIWNQVNLVARSFVRNHSDLAMSHVAAYYKSYQRAARDVAHLIDESGVEPILHDDITTHMCACVGGAVSGIIVIFTGWVLLKQRNHTDDPVSDLETVENMLLAFVLSYTLIFTVMEPLRASIKAVYVSFAQHPRSLSQAFPLIFHRLSRLSESNVS